MSSEKEFKNNLKEKLNAKEFPFDEANWLEAGKLIDASREEKKRRPFPFFIVSGIVLLVSLLSFYIFKPVETPNGLKLAVNTDSSPSKPTSDNNRQGKTVSKKNINASSSAEDDKAIFDTPKINEAIASNAKENRSVAASQKSNHTKNRSARKTSGRKIKNNSAKNTKANFTNLVNSAIVITKTKKAERRALKFQSDANDELQDQGLNFNSVSIKHEDQENTKAVDEILTVTKNKANGEPSRKK